jgi:hypothetical protein
MHRDGLVVDNGCRAPSTSPATEASEGSRRPPAHQRASVSVSSSPSSYSRLDLDHRGLTELVRASPHYYNDASDLDRLVEAVAALQPVIP